MILNFAPIEFDTEEFSLFRIKEEDKDHIWKLRKNHNSTNSFFRYKGDIYHSPMLAESYFNEGEQVSFNVNSDTELAKKLLNHVVFRKLLSPDVILTEFNPIRIFFNNREHDLLSIFLNTEQQKKIAYWRGYKVDFRQMNIESSLIYGLVLNVFYEWKIKITCAELLAKNFDIADRFVTIYEDTRSVLRPERYLVGAIEEHDEQIAKVNKNGEITEYKLEELYLENSYQNREDILEAFLSPSLKNRVLTSLRNSSISRTGGKGKYEQLNYIFDEMSKTDFRISSATMEKIAADRIPQSIVEGIEGLQDKSFARQIDLLEALKKAIGKEFTDKYKTTVLGNIESSQYVYSNQHGFSFRLKPFLRRGASEWRRIDIPRPTFIFDYHFAKTDTCHDRGLRTYGPYSSENFSPSKPLVIVICRSETRGDVGTFLGKLKDGLPDIRTRGGNGYQPYGQGFVRKYRLSGLEYKIYCVNNTSINEYERAIRQAFEENGDSIDFAIVESCEAFKMLADSENPYYFTKAKLLLHGIPSQEIRHETMTTPNSQLVYKLNNMSLAMYAKLGGIPWVTRANQNVDHELVIGIGNKIFKKGRFGFDRRIVGITTLFSGEGRYLWSNTSKDVPYEEYLQELKNSLAIGISEIQRKNNWIESDTIVLIFHVFKPFRDDEIDIIESIVNKLKIDFENILFAYLTISHGHPFLIFDERQQGVPDLRNRGRKKGIWQPERQMNVELSDSEYLLQLTGPKEVKNFRHGMSSPVLVKLHGRSTFRDVGYLTKQVYKFSCISWRGFLPASTPVTLEYSTQVAKLLGNLRASGNWNADFVSAKLKTKAWFL